MRRNEQVSAAQVAIVTSVDPAVYRVKVLYPLLGVDSEWLRVATLYAGNGWGLAALPQPGNEVLVVFANGDLNAGIVVGCLYSEQGDAPPSPGGELQLRHKSGAALRLTGSGAVELCGGGAALARVGDKVACKCGEGTIISGSGKASCG